MAQRTSKFASDRMINRLTSVRSSQFDRVSSIESVRSSQFDRVSSIESVRSSQFDRVSSIESVQSSPRSLNEFARQRRSDQSANRVFLTTPADSEYGSGEPCCPAWFYRRVLMGIPKPGGLDGSAGGLDWSAGGGGAFWRGGRPRGRAARVIGESAVRTATSDVAERCIQT